MWNWRKQASTKFRCQGPDINTSVHVKERHWLFEKSRGSSRYCWLYFKNTFIYSRTRGKVQLVCTQCVNTQAYEVSTNNGRRRRRRFVTKEIWRYRHRKVITGEVLVTCVCSRDKLTPVISKIFVIWTPKNKLWLVKISTPDNFSRYEIMWKNLKQNIDIGCTTSLINGLMLFENKCETEILVIQYG